MNLINRIFYISTIIILPLVSFSQTITTGTITGSPFCPGSGLTVPYTITGGFNAGNIFTAELSDASGSFSTPISIGTIVSSVAGSIQVTLPFEQVAGVLYRIRVVAGNPLVTGIDNGTDLAVTAATSSVFSHTKTWIGGTGNWSNPSNWSPCGLPNDASNLIIGSNSVITLLTGITASILSMQMSNGSRLNIAKGGILNINGASATALQMTDAGTTVDNNGTMNIGNILSAATGVNLFSGSVFLNNAGATLSINDITSSLANAGYGISISGNSIFTNAGVVQIGNNKAISRYGISLFTGQINNQITGLIEINRITALDGIAGNGTGAINNAGTIKIGNIAEVGQAGINITAGLQLVNETTGKIEINNIKVGDGIAGNTSNTSITNSGSIRIGNVGALNRSGISLFNSCTFNNNDGATIEIDNIKSMVTNEGRGLALNTSSSFINAGSLKIGNKVAIYRSAIFASSGKFTNQTTGLVEMNRTTLLDGISGNGNGNVNNSGIIKIGNLASLGQCGINMNNGFEFTNQKGGSLEINNIANNAAIYTNGTTSLIKNAGLIKIGNQTTLSYGLLLIGGGKLINESNAGIELDNATGVGSSCLGIFGSGSTFTNGGIVTIGKNAPLNLSGLEMDDIATFSNLATGTVEVLSNTANTADFKAVYIAGVNTLFDNAGILKIQLKAPVVVNNGLVLNASCSFNSQAGSRLELNIIQ